jgi:hypothetical protein
MVLGSTQPLTDMNTRSLRGGKGRPARKADNLTAICESIFEKMWEPRRLTILWAFTACYRDNFTLFWILRWSAKIDFYVIWCHFLCRGSSVGIATKYELDSPGLGSLHGNKVCLFHSVQTGYGAHSVSYLMGTRGKLAHGRETSHWPPSSAEVENGGAIPPLPPTKPPIQWVPGVKRPRREADHSPPTSAKIKKMWICASTPPYTFMA